MNGRFELEVMAIGNLAEEAVTVTTLPAGRPRCEPSDSMVMRGADR